MATGRKILWGVDQYLRESGPWAVSIEQRSLTDQAPPWLVTGDGDGINSRLAPRQARRPRATGIPTVDLNDRGPDPYRPHVRSDRRVEGAPAAGHLLERSFTSFALFVYLHLARSHECRRGFTAALQAAGHSSSHCCRAQRVRGATSSRPGRRRSQWIESLPKLLGLVACNDFRGFPALDARRRAGIAGPEEVGVIGNPLGDVTSFGPDLAQAVDHGMVRPPSSRQGDGILPPSPP